VPIVGSLFRDCHKNETGDVGKAEDFSVTPVEDVVGGRARSRPCPLRAAEVGCECPVDGRQGKDEIPVDLVGNDGRDAGWRERADPATTAMPARDRLVEIVLMDRFMIVTRHTSRPVSAIVDLFDSNKARGGRGKSLLLGDDGFKLKMLSTTG
jgi:hypothetical protein